MGQNRQIADASQRNPRVGLNASARVRTFFVNSEGAAWPASANGEFVRSICSPWERGDFSSTAWADPEIEYVLVDGPSPGRWTGLAAMAKAFQGVLSAYAEYQVAAEEFRELDEERVLVLHSYTGRGKTSGLEIGQIASKGADLFHVSDGKVTRLVLYWELDRALADLGLAAAGE
jgi:hypothetical protein